MALAVAVETSNIESAVYTAWGLPQSARLGSRSLDSNFDLDLQLVERCLAGDEGAWEDLVKTHTRRVYSICYRFIGKDSEAQDLTQDVFLRLFRTLKSFRSGEGSFTVWLSRMTRNLLIDNYRRTRQERVTDSIEDQLPMLEERSIGAGSRADGLLAGREAVEETVGFVHRDHRPAVLAAAAGGDHAPLSVRDPLEPVAHTQDRRDIEDRAIERRGALVGHRVGAAAQDDPGRLPLTDPLERPRGRMDLAIDTRFAHAAGDQLRELTAAIEDEDPGGHEIRNATWGRTA